MGERDMEKAVLGNAGVAVLDTWRLYTARERWNLTLGSIVLGLLALGASHVLRVPSEPGVSGAILQQPHAALAMGTVWLVIIAGSLLAAAFTFRLHYESGLFCAGIAAAVFSARFGPMKYALFGATSPAIFLTLIAELILLWAAVVIAWGILRMLSLRGLLTPEVLLDPTEPDHTLDQKILAPLSQAMIMVILILLLGQSDAKPQVLAAVGFSAYFGALLAHYFFVPTRPSIWFFSAPVLVGLFGYLMQYFTPAQWMIGDVHGFFAPLARPMPLDYMSLGVTGSLLGYWTSQRWHHESIHAADGD